MLTQWFIVRVRCNNDQTLETNMKTLKVYRDNGTPRGEYVPGWQCGTFKATQVGVGKPRKISGWCIKSPDGCERYSEGNWQQFVPYANLVLENYGNKQTVS